jgi:hypothetical protein
MSKELVGKAREILKKQEKCVKLLEVFLRSEDRELYYKILSLSQEIANELETWRYQFKKTYGRRE